MTDTTRLTAALASRYRLERELGQGGMATVYLAHDLKHDRRVAIKVLKPELAAVLGADRFVQEIKTTAALQHPHILPLFDSGQADGFLYYVMPYIEGETLRTRLDREHQLGVEVAVKITTEVADALDYAHRHGVIHRDIKPENILLHDGRPMVADFGIALAVSAAAGGRMTETGLSLGTPHYMSPEQATAEKDITGRSDIYSLASVLYEMLTGQPPHLGGSAQQIIMKIIAEPVKPATELRKSVPAHVAAAMTKALEKLPADRFDSAAKFAEAIGNSAFTTLSAPKPTVRSSSARLMTAIAVATLVAGIAIGRLLPRRTGATAVIGFRPIRLTHSGGVGCATLSPDGREFAAVIGTYYEETRCSGTLVIRAVPSGVDQVVWPRVQGVTDIRWNPTGTTLLLDGAPEGRSEGLWEIPRGSGAPRQLTTNPTGSYGFLDQQRVFALGIGAMRILDARSGETLDSLPQLHAEANAQLDWSPDGTRLVLVRSGDRRGVFLYTAGGVATDSISGNLELACWAGPSRIAYYLDRAFGTGDILIRDLDPATGRFRGSPSVLWAALPAILQISPSRTGNRLMIVVRPVVDEQHLVQAGAPNISRVSVRSLNAYLGDPHLSPDGSRIAYTREDALGFNAYWIGFDGGEEHPITGDSAATIDAKWLDDHRVYTRTSQGLAAVVDLETGRTRQVEQKVRGSLVDIYHDLSIRLEGDSARFVARDSADKVVRNLGPAPQVEAVSGAWFSAPSWLAVSGFNHDERQVLTQYSFASGTWSTPVPLTQSGIRIAGTGSDGVIYLSRFSDHTEIWRSVRGGVPTRFLTLGIHCYNGSVMVSHDGKRVVCNVTTSQPDAWLVELPKGR